jgi:hypothetical protein
MSDLDQIAATLARQGYHVALNFTGSAWSCELLCGVSVMRPELPRPRGAGKTALEAVQAAVRDRDGQKAA